MRVVIDTNILINGSYDESSHSFRTLQEVLSGRLEAFATRETLRENRLLARQMIRDQEYLRFLEDYFDKVRPVKVFKKLRVVSDSEDNKLFESAAASSAQYLISEDREVLAVEQFRNTKVLTPEEFWTKYSSNREENTAWDNWAKMIMGS